MNTKIYFVFGIIALWIISIGTAQTVSPNLHLDQFGYRPNDRKFLIISDPQMGYNSDDSYQPSSQYYLNTASDHATLVAFVPQPWKNGATQDQSGDKVWWIDFSEFSEPGDYYLYDFEKDLRSPVFTIADDVYNELLKQAMRVFYYQRCGIAKTEPHVPAHWADAACHIGSEQDLDCRLILDPGNTALSKDLSGGWHDAGDYNKYVNYTHGVLHNLLDAYEQNPTVFSDDYDIPESGNGIPDILDEIKWELDWLLKMQLDNGACLMKVSVTDFDGTSPPSSDNAVRRYGAGQSSATRTIASVFAHAAIVFKSLEDPNMQSYGELLLEKAELAWLWVLQNPNPSSYQNVGFQSSNPELSHGAQESVLTTAAAYLFGATGKSEYSDYFIQNYPNYQPFQWTFWYPFETTYQDAMLYFASLPNVPANEIDKINNSCINSIQNQNPEMLTAVLDEKDAYRSYLSNQNYVWGSNMVKAHTGLLYSNMLTYNLDFNNHEIYETAAADYLHYLHGNNPNNLIYMTNMADYGGEYSCNEMYHLWFWDGTDYDNTQTSLYGPPPGFVTGGANNYFAPDPSCNCVLEPPQNQPVQKAYKDWNTSWPENSWEITEPAIYYQAAYVKLLSKYTSSLSSVSVQEIDFQRDKVQVFPNPTTGRLQLKSNILLSDFAQIEVFDAAGKLIGTWADLGNSTWVEIDLSELKEGIYFLKISNNTSWQSKKVVVKD